MSLLVRLLSAVVALAAGAAARRALDVAWRKSTGHRPPKDATNLDDALPGVLVFAFVTAATSAIIHVLTQRAAKTSMVRLRH
ncbi:DUF4235 domain-containing protein [Specibacter sp. RAF43]|uniref:DUF4235 domain-containing protein n=1 Tax=Specibacter sp. RAF43 TaxID=3233057 RepID=UPI003F9D49E9